MFILQLYIHIFINYQMARFKPSVDNVYFEGSRKGEVNELRIMLENTLHGKDELQRRQIIKKIIAYTTLGVDTSRLFPEMILASHTSDVVQKKLIYFYLTIYAQEYSQIAIMAINTFFRDCQNPDYRIRGLSLKSLCSLKFKGAYEYIIPVVRQGLSDPEPYVKKSAVLGLAKVYYLYPELKNDLELLDKLYSLIRDDDKNVVINAILALNEILADDGGIVLTQKMMYYLLNHLQYFNQWGQTIILELLHKYNPQEKDFFDIMNLLETRLKHSSPSLILGTVKIFLKYAEMKPTLFNQIIERVKSPMITLMNCCQHESSQLTYIILQHILYMISVLKAKQLFHKQYKNFFCRANEPTYIKTVKIDILKYVASQYNLSDILNQLQEYVNEQVISRKSIAALGDIAMNIPSVEHARLIIKILLKKIQLKRQQISNESILVFVNFLRKYPNEFSLVAMSLSTLIEFVNQDQSRCALVTVLGQFGQQLQFAPAFIQQFTYDQIQFNNCSTALKQSILKTCISLFLVRPVEMKQQLGKVFHCIVNQGDVQLRDLAGFYYRAMLGNFNEFKAIFEVKRPFVGIADKTCPQYQFNTLEILYKKQNSQFVRDVKSFGRMFALNFNPQMISEEADKPIVINVDPRFKILQADDFVMNFTIEAAQFEDLWGNLQQGACITRLIQNADMITEDNLEQLFKMWRIYTIASGEQDNIIKIYYYTKVHEKQVACMELEVNKEAQTMTLMTKCENQELAGFISKYVQEFLKINEII